MSQPQSNCAASKKSFGITSVIRNVNLTVAQGRAPRRLIGPNGAGKIDAVQT